MRPPSEHIHLYRGIQQKINIKSIVTYKKKAPLMQTPSEQILYAEGFSTESIQMSIVTYRKRQ
jgi:hypothetical protein